MIERTNADALARPVMTGMRRYRIHLVDGTTATIEARDIVQARAIARSLVGILPDFHAIEGL